MRVTILARTEPGSEDTFEDAIGQVAAGLRKGGHRVSILAIQCHIGKLISGMKRRQPDLIFNLISPPQDDGPCGSTVMGLMDLLGLPYTGSGPAETMIQGDRSMIRALLAEEPGTGLSTNGNGRSHNSNGTSHSAVHGGEWPPVAILQPRVTDGWREFRVGVLGNDQPKAFPPIEVPGRLGYSFINGTARSAEPLSPEMRRDLEAAAEAACEPLRIRDYAMMDLQLNGEGRVRVTGVAPNCDLTQAAEYAQSAAAAGVDYVQLVNRIAELAFERAENRQLTRLI